MRVCGEFRSALPHGAKHLPERLKQPLLEIAVAGSTRAKIRFHFRDIRIVERRAGKAPRCWRLSGSFGGSTGVESVTMDIIFFRSAFSSSNSPIVLL